MIKMKVKFRISNCIKKNWTAIKYLFYVMVQIFFWQHSTDFLSLYFDLKRFEFELISSTGWTRGSARTVSNTSQSKERNYPKNLISIQIFHKSAITHLMDHLFQFDELVCHRFHLRLKFQPDGHKNSWINKTY